MLIIIIIIIIIYYYHIIKIRLTYSDNTILRLTGLHLKLRNVWNVSERSLECLPYCNTFSYKQGSILNPLNPTMALPQLWLSTDRQTHRTYMS